MEIGQWINALILGACFLVLFGLAELLYHFVKVKAELTRKLVHAGTGFLTLLFPLMLHNHWLVLLLCSLFAIILLLSLKFGLLPSINAIDRKSYGSLAYPVAVYGCYLAYEYAHRDLIFFYLPILALAICDPVAALCGRRWPKGVYTISGHKKTLMGSACFLFSFCVLSTVLYYLQNSMLPTTPFILFTLVAGVTSALVEAISGRGLDNLTIPGAVLLVMFGML